MDTTLERAQAMVHAGITEVPINAANACRAITVLMKFMRARWETRRSPKVEKERRKEKERAKEAKAAKAGTLGRGGEGPPNQMGCMRQAV